MTTTSLLNIGSRALTAAQGSLATISHNIANANTVGYSRQEALLQTSGGMSTGAGFFGRGVDLVTVTRAYDQFLTASVQSSAATSAADNARASGLQALDSLFADSANGIGAALDELFGAAGDLANRPNDPSVRQVFIGRASQLADRISTIGAQLQDMVKAADGQIAQDATQINGKLSQIAALNKQIASAPNGQAPNDLLDQRDNALAGLNKLISTHAVTNGDGSLSLFTTSGEPMLVGSQQARFDGAPDPSDPARTAVRMTIGNTAHWLDAPALGGGSLAGTVRFRDEDLSSAINQIGRIAQTVATAVNTQQSIGIDMNGNAGAPIFSVPGPVSRASDANSGTGSISTTITSPTALQPSDYDVSWDGSNYNVTRLSDGASSSFGAMPATMDGLSFAASGSPAVGDHWRVQPFAAASTNIAARVIGPREIATAFASTIQAAANNTGTGIASSFSIVRSAPENTQAVSITFNNPPTSFNVTGLASGNLANVPFVAGQRVPASPADYNGWSVTLDGRPAAGDTFNVMPVTSPGADNRNALALAGLSRSGLIGGATLNEAYAAALGEIGTRVQTGQAAADISSRLSEEAVARQQNVSGVNLDEEAANLLRFQQAYQASAKIIQASQALFDALLNATNH